jgi:hypothetical protein
MTEVLSSQINLRSLIGLCHELAPAVNRQILLVLLLRQKPDVARIMREADALLQGIEANVHAGDPSAYALDVLSAARAALDKLTTEAVR